MPNMVVHTVMTGFYRANVCLINYGADVRVKVLDFVVGAMRFLNGGPPLYHLSRSCL